MPTAYYVCVEVEEFNWHPLERMAEEEPGSPWTMVNGEHWTYTRGEYLTLLWGFKYLYATALMSGEGVRFGVSFLNRLNF